MSSSERPIAGWHRAGLRCVAAAGLMLLCMLGAPSVSTAALSTFGSPLSVPATLDTAENLNYEGSNIALPGSIFHISHDGADMALWNVAIPTGAPAASSGGQITAVRLEGCARQPQGAPPPLTQIHFQDLVPQPGGGATIAVTTQAFEIPVCGVGGASGSTVTTYTPTNFCVNTGDYVAFNDEGGFVPSESGPPPYPAGVPYMVIGSVPGATMDSFVRNGGTNNGTTMSPSDRTYHDGFATNSNEELMLQATLATGPDATPLCPGGTHGAEAGKSGYTQHPALAPLRVDKQTDGINHRRIASIAMFCRLAGCKGVLTMTPVAVVRHVRGIHMSFSIRGGSTVHLATSVPVSLVALARKLHKGVAMKLTASVAGTAITQTVVLRIF